MKAQINGRTSAVRALALIQMRRLTNEVSADETLAHTVAQSAEAFEQAGCFGEAEALRLGAQHHSIRGLEARSRFVILQTAYTSLQACLDDTVD